MAKLTPFGREVRKRRAERGETQADVARSLGVSVAFWSSIETGKKNISDDLLAKVIQHFELPAGVAERLRELAEASRDEVKINMHRLNDPTRELIAGFARKFESGGLSEKQLELLRKALKLEE